MEIAARTASRWIPFPSTDADCWLHRRFRMPRSGIGHRVGWRAAFRTNRLRRTSQRRIAPAWISCAALLEQRCGELHRRRLCRHPASSGEGDPLPTSPSAARKGGEVTPHPRATAYLRFQRFRRRARAIDRRSRHHLHVRAQSPRHAHTIPNVNPFGSTCCPTCCAAPSAPPAPGGARGSSPRRT